jgi:hypothetical protein
MTRRSNVRHIVLTEGSLWNVGVHAKTSNFLPMFGGIGELTQTDLLLSGNASGNCIVGVGSKA